MLELKNKQKLASEAAIMARSFNLVRYREVTYIPADYETGDTSEPPDQERTMWLPTNATFIRKMAAAQFDTLFANDGELRSFDFMVAQNSQPVDTNVTTLLVKTTEGLHELNEKGLLVKPSGEFVPNTLRPMLNEDVKAKSEVFEVIAEWVDTEEEAHSLLHHLATCLSPGYTAVKYVLLLGEGRNGKSLLLKMLKSLFGVENVSTVTRQDIADKSPTVCELNGKLLNMVFDGQAVYLKDSGMEKSLIAGEPVPIRKLYESNPTIVQTNALFVEGLQKEPKSTDKSTALQKRLIRFGFPNIYPLSHKFERKMLAEPMLGAFLSLLIDHYVQEDEVEVKLAPTKKAIELQLEHMYTNSVALQFLKYIEETDALGVVGLLDSPLTDLVQPFQSWRVKENDLGTWAEPDVLALFTPLINTERRSVRVDGSPRKVRFAISLKEEAAAFIESLKGTEDGSTISQEAVVDD